MTTTKTKTKPAIDREAVRMLVIEFGPREAARKLGLNENTVLGWAHRYEWRSPKPKQNKGAITRAQSIRMKSTPAEALIAHHKQCEEGTKTALMEAAYKAACELAKKGPLDISNTAQFQAFCSSVSRLYGWGGDSQVNVAVNNQVGVGVVITPERLEALRDRLKKLQESEDGEEQLPTKAAPLSLTVPQTQPQGSVDAESSLSGERATAQPSPSPAMRALGFDLAILESPSKRAFLEAEPVQEEPRNRNSVGW